MSLSASIASAMSGLAASARAAELVSSNIANAQTEGYARRELAVAARSIGSIGQGVQVAGVRRITDPVAIADRRRAEADGAGPAARAAFFARIAQVVGDPDAPGSLTQRLADFEAALVAAAGRPDSPARLAAIAETARALTRGLAAASAAVQDARGAADAQIAGQVRQVNEALAGVAELNARILELDSGGRDATVLLDQRQQIIDGIAGLVPLRQIDRPGGTVALYTEGGAMLLDGVTPARLSFTPVGRVVPGMTLAGGALSGLAIDGRPVATGPGSPLPGGAIAAAFAVRDDLGPAAQAAFDALARDLAERFQPPASPDATLAAGAAGLFTDAGAAVTAAAETGLAGRLELNAAADPERGGATWRLRDGLGAAAPGPAGEGRLLGDLAAALTALRVPASAGFPPGARSHAGLAGEVVTRLAADRVAAEAETAFAAARTAALRELELQGGVDTDRELQDLMTVEKAFAANARVLTAVDQMLSLILEI
jgi:flagellar hook-associated protein 1 FlgK